MKNIFTVASLFFIFILTSSCTEQPPKKEYHEDKNSQSLAFWEKNRGIAFLCTSNQEKNLNENDRTQVMYLIMQPKEEWRDWSSEKETYKFRSSFVYKIFEFSEESEPMFSFYELNEDFLYGVTKNPEVPTRLFEIDYQKQVPAFRVFQRIRFDARNNKLNINAQSFVSNNNFTSHKSLYARHYDIKINRESLNFYIKPKPYKGNNGDWIFPKFSLGGSCKISNNIEIKKALIELSKRASAKKIEFEIKQKQEEQEKLKQLNQENEKQLQKNKI